MAQEKRYFGALVALVAFVAFMAILTSVDFSFPSVSLVGSAVGVSEEGEADVPTCTDSDNGLEPRRAGETTGFQAVGGKLRTFTDYCSPGDPSRTQVIEHFCVGDSVESTVISCPPRKECRNGACY